MRSFFEAIWQICQSILHGLLHVHWHKHYHLPQPPLAEPREQPPSVPAKEIPPSSVPAVERDHDARFGEIVGPDERRENWQHRRDEFVRRMRMTMKPGDKFITPD